jgi:hypothetical protein
MLDSGRLGYYSGQASAQQGLVAPWSRLMVVYGESLPAGVDWEENRPVAAIPQRHVYMILHAISVLRLPDRLPLPAVGLRMSIDHSQWAWTLSLDLAGAGAEALIEPVGADPVRIEVQINGAVWVFVAENWGATERFGAGRGCQVTGRSLTALLSSRYILPRSYAEANARTIDQLADQELPYGGGWTLDWQAPSWSVPAGAWTYQDLAPIQAIGRLAQSCVADFHSVMSVRPISSRERRKPMRMSRLSSTNKTLAVSKPADTAGPKSSSDALLRPKPWEAELRCVVAMAAVS